MRARMRRAALAGMAALGASNGAYAMEFHGAGWLQGGKVEASWELPEQTNDYKKNWIGQTGAVISLETGLDSGWDCAMGLGTVMTQLARGSRGQAAKWYPFWTAWVDQARVGYAGDLGKFGLRLDLGVFRYGYNPDVKDFGQYLLNGYVYPGTLTLPKTGPLGADPGLTGIRAGLRRGGWSNDFVIKVETEDKPYYDVSLADVMAWRPAKGIELGAGVNWYRALPADGKATSPGKDCQARDLGINTGQTNQPNVCFILDSIGTAPTGETVYDTITGSLSGVKLMGRVRVDPKAWLGPGWGAALGGNALVVYSELAVIGLKDYPVYYDDILRRIPVMAGIGLPGFGYFEWSVEAQYYASKYTGDDLGAQNGVWLPTLNPSLDAGRDDWKWAIHASKAIGRRVSVAGQIANDDLRLGGYHYEPAGKEAMRTPSDWYWTLKLSGFF